MIAKVFNDFIWLENMTSAQLAWVTKELTCTDKGKEFQYKRAMKNPYTRYKPETQALKGQIKVPVFEQTTTGLRLMTGLYDRVASWGVEIEDNRKVSKQKIAYPWAKRPYDLRPYQQETLQAMLARQRGIASLATGLGKSLIMTHLIRELHRRTLLIVPNVSLANQMHEQLSEAFGPTKVGLFGDGKKQVRDITVGISTSVRNHAEAFKLVDVKLVLIDEGHHTPCSTIFETMPVLGDVDYVYGFSATPYRQDGKDLMLEAVAGGIAIDRDARWGIANGWLAEPYFLVRKVRTGQPDYRDKLKAYKSHVLKSSVMNERILSDARGMIGAGKPTLVLVDMVEHGRMLAESLGVPFCTGSEADSASVIKDFNSGAVNAFVATEGMVGEGVDLKRLEVVVMANFAASKGFVTQCVGRAIRIHPGKTHAILLDYQIEDSDILCRHSWQRVDYYKEISDNVKVVG